MLLILKKAIVEYQQHESDEKVIVSCEIQKNLDANREIMGIEKQK